MSEHRKIMTGMIGGGYLLAGFGPPGAVIGMILGAVAGYLLERHLAEAQAGGARGEEVGT